MHTYTTEFSDKTRDQEWDDFLNAIEGNNHVQSSMWAQLKQKNEQYVRRICAKKEGKIVGGIQSLVQKVKFNKKVAYIANGPVYDHKMDDVGVFLLDTMVKKLISEKIDCIIIQPQQIDENITTFFSKNKFFRSPMELSPAATSLVDLTLDQEILLARMKRKTRYNVKLSSKKGIKVREGNQKDLAEFYRIMKISSENKKYNIFDYDYYNEIWDIFSPKENVKLLFAEYNGKLLVAQLSIVFGDRVVNKFTGWTGEEGKRKPNEATMWNTILWAKSHGYRFFDLGGLTYSTGAKILQEGKTESQKTDPVDNFKLGFGGDVVITTKSYMRFRNVVYNTATKNLFKNSKFARYILDFAEKVRTR